MPYRQTDRTTAAPPARSGVVSEMVRQFADPYAFLRELVQNSIDAGASRVEVSLTLERGGRALTRVVDDGCGMSAELIESALCTLFSTSKERDPRMIGKYGVGFISVFALEPRVVEVVTWREGGAHRLVLGADHRWVLERAGAREGSGTWVTLHKPMEPGEFTQHRRAAEAALRRWCRHAHVPLYLSVLDEADPESSSVDRVDVPFDVAATVSATERTPDATIVVGVSAGADLRGAIHDTPESAATFTGFYKRGLTLFESDQPLLGGLTGVRCKIESDRLAHTLSRDDVLRDGAFRELSARARRLARRELPGALAARLATAAQAGAAGDVADYAALLVAACTPPTQLRARDLRLALVEPLAGEMSAPLDRVLDQTPWREPLLLSAASDPLTRALAGTGRPVLWCAHPRVAECLCELGGRLPLLSRRACVPAALTHTLLEELSPHEWRPTDGELCLTIQSALCQAGCNVGRVALCNVLGARPQRFAFVLPEQERWLYAANQLVKRSRGWGDGRVLALDAASEPVRLARQKCASPVLGTLLARMIVLDATGVASARVNDRLVDPQLEAAR